MNYHIDRHYSDDIRGQSQNKKPFADAASLNKSIELLEAIIKKCNSKNGNPFIAARAMKLVFRAKKLMAESENPAYTVKTIAKNGPAKDIEQLPRVLKADLTHIQGEMDTFIKMARGNETLSPVVAKIIGLCLEHIAKDKIHGI